MSIDNEKPAEQQQLLETAIPALERLDRLIENTNGAQIAALNNVISDLGNLEKVLAADQAALLTSLSNFEAHETLERLEKLATKQRTEFDALDLIGQLRFGRGRDLWGSEEFHSGVLAWLLDPKQSHGHGDQFLKDFLYRAGVRLAGHSTDWSETEVIREWENVVDGQQGYLDILIVNEASQILCAIENKVFSSEHSEQLTRYRLALANDDVYSTYARHHVFLTPRGDHAFRDEEKEHWTPLAYSAVFEIVQQIVEDTNSLTNEDIGKFLRQYTTALRRNVMPETSVPQLARKIYLEHREAIDQIIAHKPDWVAEARQWLREAIAQHGGWKFDEETPAYVRFRSTDWDRYESTQTGTGFAPSNALFLFEFYLSSEPPLFSLALSPENEDNKRLRQKLFDAVQQHPHLFRPKHTALPKAWAYLHQESGSILDEEDYGIGWDDGATRAKLEAWVSRFAKCEFPAMNKVIVNCLREYEADEQS